jgi:dTDP-4-amino-4,6-dideoxygalactose transaminase
MTTGGEGGMVTTDSQALRDTMWSYKDHGKNETAAKEGSDLPKFRPVHDGFGTNWRMLEIQAAIGRLQLGSLDGWLEARARNAAMLRRHLEPYDAVIRVPVPDAGDVHAYYRLYGYVRPEGLAGSWSRDRILAELIDLNLGVSGGSCPEIYLEKAFDGTGFAPPQRLPNALALGETSLAFLTHPTLSEADMARVGEEVGKVLARAAR